MCPLGTGLLNQAGGGSRELLNLFGARHVVFDKTDPDMQSQQMQQVLAAYRQMFPIALENKDFAVFRNETANAYVTAYSQACLLDGDVVSSPQLALVLAARNWPLVHGSAGTDAVTKYAAIYRDGNAPPPLRNGEIVSLTGVQVVREGAERIRIRLTAARDCLIVISESYYPFWRGELDGKPTEVLRVSCALMGVEVPAGQHEIMLRYEPPRTYAVAAIVSIVTLVSGAGYAIRDRLRSPR
jgi:hypothetical protein